MKKRSETYTEAIMAILTNPKVEPESAFTTLKQLYRDLARAERQEERDGPDWSV